MARTLGRQGYALLAVIWICAGITALSTLLLEAARQAVASSHNRIALAAAGWNAAACIAHASAVLQEVSFEESRLRAAASTRVWNRVDRVLAMAPPPPLYACERTASAVGARLDLNAADQPTLAKLYRILGLAAAPADSAAMAIVAAKPFASVLQLRHLRGPVSIHVLDSLVDVEPGPVALNQAPAQILGLLPGFTPELVRRVMDARSHGVLLNAFLDLSGGLSQAANDSLARQAARLPAMASLEPQAWVVTARSRAGKPAVTVVVEVRIQRSGARTMLTRRRAWIE